MRCGVEEAPKLKSATDEHALVVERGSVALKKRRAAFDVLLAGQKKPMITGGTCFAHSRLYTKAIREKSVFIRG